MIENAQNSVVIDPGSGMLKGGFAFEEIPSICFQNLIGKPKYGISKDVEKDFEHLIGAKAIENRNF